MHEGASREFLQPPERIDVETLTYIWERLALIGIDFELEPLQTYFETDEAGIVTIDSLIAFAEELKTRIEQAPIHEAKRFAELELFTKVMGTLGDIALGR
ncbi:MAG: hypothetical protein ABSD10_03345 [Candidatus Saccharimonadales bacterium]|jgi:hypothetical protein